jgi:aminoglycoside N3'-acetyltransferase
VSNKKTVLIVTDGTEKINLMAKDIAAGLKGNKVSIKEATVFEGIDLLPADVLFFGCEKPNPPSFKYIEQLLSHINLAGRSMGFFSADSKAVQYLKKIAKDADAFCAEPLLADSEDEGEWAAKVLLGK